MADEKLPPQRQFVALDWLSLASCSWAELACVSPADLILVGCLIMVKFFSSRCFSFGFANFPGGGEFGFMSGLDHFGSALQFVFRCNIAYIFLYFRAKK